jgi:hypothetical protein
MGNNGDSLTKAGISHRWATEIYRGSNPDCIDCARWFKGWTWGIDCRDMIGKTGSGKCFRPMGTALAWNEVEE